jgi:hypothetical protein
MRTVATYVFLVGLPVLGVLLILRLGQNLTPPVSVGGSWQIEPATQITGEAGCSTVWESLEQLTLTISQSGPNFVLTVDTNPPVSLAGVITDTFLTATADQTGDQFSAPVTHLEATLDRQVEPDRLSGSLSVSGCSTTLPFTALRQSTSLAGAVNH